MAAWDCSSDLNGARIKTAQPLQGHKYLNGAASTRLQVFKTAQSARPQVFKRRSALKEAQPLQVPALKGRGFSRAIKPSQK
jgi:hypothetical protein